MKLLKLGSMAKKCVSVILATGMILSVLPQDMRKMTASEKNVSAAALRNPRIEKDSSLDAGQKVTWDCIYFGSYPQTEIVDKKENSGTYERTWAETGDYEVDAKTYAKLTSQTNWDSNGDAVIDGTKYRRISADDIAKVNNGASYFNWSDKNDTSYHYFRYDKIKWRVLDVQGGEAFLLADRVLECQSYHTKETDVTWEKSALRSFMNGKFLDCAFTTEEENVIKKSDVKNNNNLYTNTQGGNDTQDKIFLLSESEIHTDTAKSYGFVNGRNTKDNARRSKSSTYAKAEGVFSDTDKDLAGNCSWWLRSPGGDTDIAARIFYDGNANWSAYVDETSGGGVRPALKLNISSGNLWTHAGTVSSDGTFNSTDIPDGGDTDTGDKDDDKVEIKQPEYKDKESANLPTPPSSIKIFDKVSGNTNDPITQFFPGDFSIGFPMINTKAEVESNDDGGYTLKMSMGSKDNLFTGSEKTWDKYKKDIDDAFGNIKKLDTMNSLMSAFNAKQASFTITSKFEAKPSIQVLGYYEMKCDENGAIISDTGKLVLSLEWKGSKTQQCLTAPIPIPYYIESSGSIKAKGAGSLEKVKDSKAAISGSINLVPAFSIGAGVGVSGVATLGVSGDASLDWQLLPWTTGTLSGSASVKAKIMFVFDGSYTLAKVTLPLWDTTTKAKESASQTSTYGAQTKAIQESSQLTLTDRSYQDKTSAWHGNTAQTKARVAADTAVSLKELQSYILPNTIPKMIKYQDDLIMIFQSNDAERETQNSVKLMYSIYHDGSWSQPKAFLDDGTLDTFADIKQIGDDVFVAWQKCSTTIGSGSAEEQIKSMVSASGIYISQYDPSTRSFEVKRQIVNKNRAYIMPQLIDKNGNAAFMWIEMELKNPLTFECEKTIMTSQCDNGAWNIAIAPLQKTNAYISELKGTYSKQNGTYQAFFVGIDEEQKTKLYYMNNSNNDGMKQLTDGNHNISNISANPDEVTYLEDGVLKSYDINKGESQEITNSEQPFTGANAVQVSNGNKDVVIWMENDTTGCNFYSSVKTENGYSKPVNLYTKSGVSGNNFTAVMDDDGAWDIVFSATDLQDSEKTSLYHLHKKSEPKLVINDMILDSEAMTEKGKQPISYTVTNNSEETLKSFELTISNDDGTILQKEVSCNILPGESAFFEDTFTFDNLSKIENFTVQTIADGQTDMTDTQLKKEVSYCDLAISDVKKEIVKDGVKYTVTIKNEGQTDTSGNLNIYADNQLSNKQETKEIKTVKAGESSEISVEYKTKDMKFDASQNAYCSMQVTANDKDSNSQNDCYYGVVYRWELPGENNISDCTVILENERYTPDGTAKTPEVTVKRGELQLIKGVDYDVKYQNNINAGTATVIITGKNRYTGSIKKNFQIGSTNTAGSGTTNPGITKPSDAANDSGQKPSGSEKTQKITKISIKGISHKIAAGTKILLTADILPKQASNQKITWKSSNPKIATVDSKGRVTIKKKTGKKTVTITAAANDGSGKKAAFRIKVMKGIVKKISIKGKKTVKAGKTLKLKAKIKASKGANKKLLWTSSNTRYAAVSSTGKVKAQKAGKKKTVIITAMATDGSGKKARIKLKIK